MRFLKILSCCLICMAAGLAPGQTDDRDSLGRPLVYQGMITVKVEEGVGPFAKQEGLVQLGIASLDALVQEYEIQSVAYRFKHRPIDPRRGLPDLSRIYRLTFPAQLDLWSVVQAFAKDPHVEYAEPIPCAYLAEVPEDPLYSEQQHLPQIMAAEAWDIHHGEDGAEPVVVAIVDTGVEYSHPDLAENVWQNLGEDADNDGQTLVLEGDTWILDPGDLNDVDDDNNGYDDDLIGWDFHNETEDQDNDPADVAGHGTHCAGIAAGVTDNRDGIASVSWNVEVMITKHNNNDPAGEIVDGYDGILYAAQNGADIISNSWGYTYPSAAHAEVIQVVTGLGSVVVAAAHNHGKDWPILDPAVLPGVIAVAAVDVNDVKTGYSNYGMWVDIAAPGGEAAVDGGILSTVIGGDYGRMSGTSMATPMTAGLMALVKSYHPDWSNEQLVTQILGTADDLGPLNPAYENMLGSGRINAFRALDESGVSLPQALRVALSSVSCQDADEDGIIEGGELVGIDVKLRNFAHFVGDDDVMLTLTCDDPEVTILAGSWSGPLPADGYLELVDIFQIQIAEESTSHEVILTLALDSDLEVLFGQEMQIALLVAPAGVLVWEGIPDGPDHSGVFIRDTLQQLVEVTYTNNAPQSFLGFDAIFLSRGNPGEFLEQPYSSMPSFMVDALIEYLQQGGNVYYEYANVLGSLWYLSDGRLPIVQELFGIASFSFCSLSQPTPVTVLHGQPGTVGESMVFHDSTQESNWYIDRFVPDENGNVVFINEGWGNVAVQAEGDHGQKTFAFSYALADLVDEEMPSTREQVLLNLVDFFELETVGVAEDVQVPAVPVLAGNYPNPFNPSTEIRFGLSRKEEVEIAIFGLDGRRVCTLVQAAYPAGWHGVRWDGQDAAGKGVASGVYFVRMQTERATESRKMMLVK